MYKWTLFRILKTIQKIREHHNNKNDTFCSAPSAHFDNQSTTYLKKPV